MLPSTEYRLFAAAVRRTGRRVISRFWTIILLMFWIAAPALAVELSVHETLKPTLTKYCGDCHHHGAVEGGLDLDRVGFDLDDEATFATWERIYDRVDTGEMPPEDAQALAADDLATFRQRLGKALHAAHSDRKGTVLRRLNRREYENTMNDLFGTRLDLESLLPEDGRSHEFDNVGSSLSISMVQLRRYLQAVDSVMDAAIAKTTQKPQSVTKLANYADTREGESHVGSAWKLLDDGAVVFFRGGGYPSGMLRTANVRKAGRYRIRVTGYAHQSESPITFAIGATTFSRGAERPTFAYRSFAPGEPQSTEVEAWIDENYMVDLTPWGINDGGAVRKHGVNEYDGPGLAVVNVELEGPLVDEFPSRGHRLLFDGLRRVEKEPSNPNVKSKSWYVPTFEIESRDLAADVNRVLTRVATSAFRRPVSKQEVARYETFFETQMKEGEKREAALRSAVAAIFCSPDFLYLREPEGWLDDHAIASRLAYFLTRTTPDKELLAAANAGRLSNDPEALRKQTRRLLKDPRSDRFVVDFTDAWLNLRDIDFTSPDKSLYPEFDAFLQFSMLAETRQFVRALITDNASVSNIVRSDFAILNNRLAKHYQIDDVSGPELRKVSLDADSVRGGLLSQASVLKVSANGTNTSPVVRGVWVLERIMGITPPPPPPGVPGVEPDIRGASTLRELLDKHRNVDTCRSCHTMIDPPGFALESFDPIGGWRDRFRSLGEGERVNVEVDGRRVRYRLGPDVDASGQMTDGTQFEGFLQFRERLAREEDHLAGTLAKKLLTFASGREMGFSDRATVDRMVQESKAKGHGLGNLIELVVLSDVFRRK